MINEFKKSCPFCSLIEYKSGQRYILYSKLQTRLKRLVIFRGNVFVSDYWPNNDKESFRKWKMCEHHTRQTTVKNTTIGENEGCASLTQP